MYRIHGKNTLVGTGSEAEKRRRRAYVEEISILQESLRQYRGEIPAVTKADMYATIGFRYKGLGKYREARSSYLQAITYNRWSWSTPAYVAHIFIATLRSLLDSKMAQSAKLVTEPLVKMLVMYYDRKRPSILGSLQGGSCAKCGLFKADKNNRTSTLSNLVSYRSCFDPAGT